MSAKQFKISGLKEDSSHIHDQLSNDEIEKKEGTKISRTKYENHEFDNEHYSTSKK